MDNDTKHRKKKCDDSTDDDMKHKTLCSTVGSHLSKEEREEKNSRPKVAQSMKKYFPTGGDSS